MCEDFGLLSFTGNYLIRNEARILDVSVEYRHFSPQGIVAAPEWGGGYCEFLKIIMSRSK